MINQEEIFQAIQKENWNYLITVLHKNKKEIATDSLSVEQADRYYNLIIGEIEFICKNIHSGKAMDHIRKGYRVSKVKSHLIFYRISNEQIIEVIRILHESMDIPNRLTD